MAATSNYDLNYDHVMKLALVSDSGVGKSCLLVDGKRVKLRIWDTADQERFRSITSAYYRGVDGILLVYDVTSESSFNNVLNWIRTIEQNEGSDKVNKVLVGNKADVDERQRAVSTAQGQALAEEYGIKFFKTSAKTNVNVEQMFFSIARDIKRRLHPEPNSRVERSVFEDQPVAPISACCGF
ncbi:OLC1v1015480C1 [Oldenlandia corymbosa var. corymbosa]|uniref:OLC1v1015480C1 n=1 Tax=Oldenlandia corymbosa var. corymbosa TaxID=529605 RepID=A0AAV1E3J2_OLDCO|nr:OLC1v1015480C1 [Oldenlandia corymbosa var. corymbosa]